MRNTKILELAQIQTKTITVAGMEFKVREPNTMEMITYHEHNDTEKGGSRAKGYQYLFRNFVFNLDGTPAFEDDEALAIAQGSPRASGPFIKAILGWISDIGDEGKGPKDGAPVDSSPSN